MTREVESDSIYYFRFTDVDERKLVECPVKKDYCRNACAWFSEGEPYTTSKGIFRNLLCQEKIIIGCRAVSSEGSSNSNNHLDNPPPPPAILNNIDNR
jgi:hypothetical protein